MDNTGTIIVDVDLASDWKELIINNDNIKFTNDTDKTTILKSDNDDFLMIKKRIGSDTTILSVKKVDSALIKSLLC